MQTLTELRSALKLPLTGPEIILPNTAAIPVQAGLPYRSILHGLKNGKTYFFEGTYGTAMGFYSWLKNYVSQRYPIRDYQSSRQNRNLLNKLSNNLLVHVQNGQVRLRGAPQLGWFTMFYPEMNDYFVRFTEYLGLNGAWQWYVKGISYPGLQQMIYPLYGVYFPTRHEHLSLFQKWLAKQTGFSRAIDIGTGCGVLTFYMLQHGISNISASDINPNSLYSLALNLNVKESNQVELLQTSLLEGIETSDVDLIVFNPPWIPEQSANMIDKSVYYNEGFFEAYFNQVYEKIDANCKLVVLFSTFAQAAGIEGMHPIQSELDKQRFKVLEYYQSSVKQRPSKQKSWLSEIRAKEKSELWVLTKK